MVLAGANDQQQNAAPKPMAPTQPPVIEALGWGPLYFVLGSVALLYVTLQVLGKEQDRRYSRG